MGNKGFREMKITKTFENACLNIQLTPWEADVLRNAIDFWEQSSVTHGPSYPTFNPSARHEVVHKIITSLSKEIEKFREAIKP
jgi:hypothetical protein